MKASFRSGVGRKGFSIFAALAWFVLFVPTLLVVDVPSLDGTAAVPQQKKPAAQSGTERLDVTPQKKTVMSPGAKIAAATVVTVPVPNVKNQTLDDAVKILSNARLKLGKVTYGYYDAAPGRVARQFPDAGQGVTIGSAVDVWVAPDQEPTPPPPPKQPPTTTQPEKEPGRVQQPQKGQKPKLEPQFPKPPGKKPVEVPDLTYQTEATAQSILMKRGLRYGGGKQAATDKMTPGMIFDQRPRPGTLVPEGTSVIVAVAVATKKPAEIKIPVPDLFHHTRSEATQMLQQAGLQANDADISTEDSEEETGFVLSQNPQAGTMVLRGTAIRFAVSQQIAHTLVLRSDPSSAVPGKPVTFAAELDPPYPAAIFQFSFGEGAPTKELTATRTSHRYADDGDYVAFVTATLGSRQLISNRVVIPVHGVSLKVTLSRTPDHGKTGDTIAFYAKAEPEPAAGSVEYSFNYGDGKPAEASRSPYARHSYAQSKTYAAWVTVKTTHKPLPGGRNIHEHQFVSEPVLIGIVEPPVLPWRMIGIFGAAMLLAGAGAFSGYRWYVMKKLNVRITQDAGRPRVEIPAHPIAGVAMQIRAVSSPGEQTLECSGPLWTRIERIHE